MRRLPFLVEFYWDEFRGVDDREIAGPVVAAAAAVAAREEHQEEGSEEDNPVNAVGRDLSRDRRAPEHLDRNGVRREVAFERSEVEGCSRCRRATLETAAVETLDDGSPASMGVLCAARDRYL